MNNHQAVAHGLHYTILPRKFTVLSEDIFSDEFEWDEATNQYEGNSFTKDLSGFLQDLTAD
jgi:hypothetical protein